jgi:peptidyl-tRNA hydrolase
LYIIVRKDISAGLQLSQACHSAFHFSQQHPEITSQWMTESDYICILNIDSEEELIKIIQKASQEDIKHSIFKEPDINNEVTAIALAPGQKSKKLCANLKLALKGL